MKLTRSTFAVIALAGGCAGCAVSDPLGASTGGALDAGGPPGPGPDATSCGPPVDPATLPACCPDPGGAHCLSEDRVPAGLRDALEPCPEGGLCVPDPLIVGAPARPCTSIGDAPGACTSLCVPDVRAAADVLPSDVCDEGERCAPCVSPIDGEPTGACATTCEGDSEVGPDPDGGPGVARCCSGAGACLPITVVGDDAARLGVDVCPTEAGLVCVPDVFLDGDFIPPPCSTGLLSLLFGDAYRPGVCMPDCIPAVAQGLFLGQDGCGTGFLCAPCLTPPGGASSGACDPL